MSLAFKHIFRLLTFRISREEILQFNNKHFLIGLIATWLVGIGRWWDDPNASLLQHLGLGSVIYIFLLALFIYILVWPFQAPNWNYKTLLIFISLTSFPAALYAIPVERLMSMSTAASINAWFLGLVAIYRVSLLLFFLKRFTKLNSGRVVLLVLMPIFLIIFILTILNLERAVFEIMGGIRNATANDSAYVILNILTFFSVFIAPVITLIYISEVVKIQLKKKKNN